MRAGFTGGERVSREAFAHSSWLLGFTLPSPLPSPQDRAVVLSLGLRVGGSVFRVLPWHRSAGLLESWRKRCFCLYTKNKVLSTRRWYEPGIEGMMPFYHTG